MIRKGKILEIAKRLGFQRTVIASVKPMEVAAIRYQQWIDKGYAATMNYLNRNPIARNDPAQLVPESQSVIICSVSYYTEVPPPPGPFFGRVAGYAVGLDYHTVLRDKFRLLQDQIESELGRPLFGKSFTDDVQLNERALAARHGLGFKGRHTLIIGPKLSGSYNFIGELFTDLELEPDEAYAGTCGKCFRCGDACPTNAITSDNEIDSNRCISFLTIENKVGIPIELRLKLGNWVFGCDICQEVCPYNQRPDQTPWKEFLPDAGVGHYLDLPQLLEIKDEAEFRKLYAHTPLSRAKRSGLLRNALVVMGNALRTQSEPLIDRYEHFKAQRDNQIDIRNSKAYESSAVIDRIKQFMRSETNPMLIEHATWALSQQEMM